jgi:hypothetical protein
LNSFLFLLVLPNKNPFRFNAVNQFNPLKTMILF